jgi:hypothetical protein
MAGASAKADSEALFEQLSGPAPESDQKRQLAEGLPVRHRLLLTDAHRLGIYGPLLNENTITRFGQRTL